jgi:hypothetical protein
MKPTCNKCLGLGLAAYIHIAGGRCFACGAAPVADDTSRGPGTSSSRTLTPRERSIWQLECLLLRAAEEKGAARSNWFAMAVVGVRCELRDAPEDVRVRAIKAFAKLGLAA